MPLPYALIIINVVLTIIVAFYLKPFMNIISLSLWCSSQPIITWNVTLSIVIPYHIQKMFSTLIFIYHYLLFIAYIVWVSWLSLWKTILNALCRVYSLIVILKYTFVLYISIYFDFLFYCLSWNYHTLVRVTCTHNYHKHISLKDPNHYSI